MIKVTFICDRCDATYKADIDPDGRHVICNIEKISGYKVVEDPNDKTYLLCLNCKNKLDAVKDEAVEARDQKLRGFFLFVGAAG